MSFIAGIVTGALLALMVSWYVRHPEEHNGVETTVKQDSNERDEHERFVKEQQRQFDKLMQYTGKDQRA
jgi:hypothetical protein